MKKIFSWVVGIIVIGILILIIVSVFTNQRHCGFGKLLNLECAK